MKLYSTRKVDVSEIASAAAVVNMALMIGTEEDDLRAAFGQRLIAARKAAGFVKQNAFAAELGISSSRLSQWEAGRRTPDMFYLGKIITITGVTLDWLYFGNPAGMAYGLIQRLGGLMGR